MSTSGFARVVTLSATCAALVALEAGTSFAAAPDPASKDVRLEKRNALAWEAQRFRASGKLSDAIAAAEQMLAVEREIYGESHEDLAGALEFAAGVYKSAGSFETAQAKLQQALAMRERTIGKDHWLVSDARYALDRVNRLCELTADQRKRFVDGSQRLTELNRERWHSYDYVKLIA
jgi:hypothetical protein